MTVVEPENTAQAEPANTAKGTPDSPAKRRKAKRSSKGKKRKKKGILTPETPLPAPFDTPLDTPYPDGLDELESSPFDAEASIEEIKSAEIEASIEITNQIEEAGRDDGGQAQGIASTDLPFQDTEAVDVEASIDKVVVAPEPEISAQEADTAIEPPSQQETATTIEPPAETEIATQPLPEKQARRRRRPQLARAGLLLVSLAVFLTSSLLIWQDISATHLYISSFNPANGAMLTREDMGNRYSGDTIIAPTAGPSPVFFALVSGQQTFLFQQHGTSWQQQRQFSTPLRHGTLSVTKRGDLIIESEHGLEVTTSHGQLLWQMAGDQPALGVHAFQPAFDSDTLYTVKSATAGQIAAYDLQTGSLRWTANLRDTLNYAPPLLLAGRTLYVAGDHTIFALNSSDGTVLWTSPHAARTLLLSNSGSQHLLIAASADGLLALSASDGSPVWTFHGRAGSMTAAGVLSLTPAQFYQASEQVSATNTTIFASGIAWKAPQIQPELWLYALDAATGNVRWSRQLAASAISADAGRVFTPLVDSAQHLVILEQQQDSSTLSIAAFDADSGQPRWQSQFQDISAAPTALLEPSHSTLLFISLQADSGTALRSMTIERLLLLATTLLSFLALLLLLFFPWGIQKQRYQQALNRLARGQPTTARKTECPGHSWRKLAIIVLLVGWLAACVVGYTQLDQAQESIALLDIHSGLTHWQHTATASTEALAANAQGSILAVPVAGDGNMQRVQAIDTNGILRWQTFASAGTFSVPAVSAQPGTLLLALSGHNPMPYAFAPADPAYPPPLDSLFVLSLLNLNTGQLLWQSAIVTPGDQQRATVLGADAHLIYLAIRQTNSPTGAAAIQLMAMDQSSGLVAWRVFGPQEPLDSPPDNGTLLLQGRRIFWQVDGAVYVIDSQMGQIAWRRSFGSDDPRSLLQEEGQLAETNNLLLVARSKSIYAIGPAFGNTLWTTPIPTSATSQSTSGLNLVGNNTLLAYGNEQIEAIDLTSQHIIWTRKLSAPATHPVGAQFIVRTADLSASSKQIYIALSTNNGSSPMLMALDSKTGATLWQFHPSGQAIFTNVDIIANQNTLLATLCITSTQQVCSHEDMYALNTATGTINWQVTATSISHIQISPDGSAMLLQKDGSGWQQVWHG